MPQAKVNIIQVIKLLCWKYFKFSRPSNINISGKISFNRYAKLSLSKQSNINILGDLELNSSSLILENSSLAAAKLVIQNSLVELHNSNLTIGDMAHFKNAHLNFNESELTAEEHFRIHSIEIMAQKSIFKIGSYFLGQHLKAELLKWRFIEAKVLVGKNTRMQCAIFQHGATLGIGNNTFINAGTSISCLANIKIGNYVMISYDCIIFDNNSHALDYRVRRQEIDNGFPNGTSPSINQETISAAINIADDVWIGARCTILKGISINSKSVVASNTVVTKNVNEHLLVYGNPNKYRPIEIA